ncbi:phosphoribosyltransferase family protein [Campylobacter armoricus]|uniref:phosphoribosyltransferase family protein n=1 Tax=Campylobacter armoricus TaxID=2505970 RepID=UPI00191BF17D|nr:phosphoribosyltransferase family protein [Campylobacter armoricus]
MFNNNNDDLIGIKFKKYFKRYFPNKSKIYNFDENALNSFQRNIFSEIEYVVINSFELEVKSVKKLLKYFSKYCKIIVIQKSDKNTYRTFKNVTLIKISNYIGFHDKVGEVCSFASADILIDYFVESVVKSMKNNFISISYNNVNSKIIPYKQKFCSLRFLYQGDPGDIILSQSVGSFRIKLGELLASNINDKIISRIDFIVPVPSSGIFYAVGLSKMTKIPMLPALKKIKVSKRAFEIQDVDVRKRYLFDNIQIYSDLIKDKNIILVDEAIFTGATLKVVCEILKRSGVKKIYLAIPSPKCFSQCKYLVHPERNLLLDKISENYISSYFKVNGVIFLPLTEYIDVLNKIDDRICYECFLKDDNV